jgi:prefoldin subunit 5
METKLARSREVMKSKMPDIKKSLKAIEMVSKKSKEEDPSFTTTILMTDNIWTKCKIPNNTGKVCLWLGANVMIEYAYEEAEKLLSTNLGNAQTNIQATVF